MSPISNKLSVFKTIPETFPEAGVHVVVEDRPIDIDTVSLGGGSFPRLTIFPWTLTSAASCVTPASSPTFHPSLLMSQLPLQSLIRSSGPRRPRFNQAISSPPSPVPMLSTLSSHRASYKQQGSEKCTIPITCLCRILSASSACRALPDRQTSARRNDLRIVGCRFRWSTYRTACEITRATCYWQRQQQGEG